MYFISGVRRSLCVLQTPGRRAALQTGAEVSHRRRNLGKKKLLFLHSLLACLLACLLSFSGPPPRTTQAFSSPSLPSPPFPCLLSLCGGTKERQRERESARKRERGQAQRSARRGGRGEGGHENKTEDTETEGGREGASGHTGSWAGCAGRKTGRTLA